MCPSPSSPPSCTLLSPECEAIWQEKAYVPLSDLFRSIMAKVAPDGLEDSVRNLCEAYNGAETSRAALRAAAAAGDEDAANTEAWMQLQGIAPAPCRRITAQTALLLQNQLHADPVGFLSAGNQLYPASSADQHWGFDPSWVRQRLDLSRQRLQAMAQARRKETAVLVGNGPSLNRSDLSLLADQDVYLSNYAIRHPQLGAQARGIAITNHFVAAQEPQLFHPAVHPGPQWRVYPVWLGHVLPDSPQTIWLNALGGDLFFAKQIEDSIAWHATVSYFWLQILLHLGYRKVVLIGFDHSYSQPPGLGEGTVLHQTEADPNHFDPNYFRNKKWQSADVDHMAQGYRLARRHYEAAGREIVNCTEGGALEVFRRAPLGQELKTA